MIIILNFYKENKSFSEKDIVKSYSHNLNKLLQEVNLDIELIALSSREEMLLTFFDKFGGKSRYYNLDYLSDSNKNYYDPINEWFRLLEKNIELTQKQLNKLNDIANLAKLFPKGAVSVLHIGENNQDINTMEEAMSMGYRMNFYNLEAKVWVIHIVRKFTDILINLGDKTRHLNIIKTDIPYINEFFTIFYNEDGYLKNKKNLKI